MYFIHLAFKIDCRRFQQMESQCWMLEVCEATPLRVVPTMSNKLSSRLAKVNISSLSPVRITFDPKPNRMHNKMNTLSIAYIFWTMIIICLLCFNICLNKKRNKNNFWVLLHRWTYILHATKEPWLDLTRLLQMLILSVRKKISILINGVLVYVISAWCDYFSWLWFGCLTWFVFQFDCDFLCNIVLWFGDMRIACLHLWKVHPYPIHILRYIEGFFVAVH